MGKIINRSDLDEAVKKWRADEKVIVFTNGCFDIIHRGHVEYLSKAKSLGDILILGLNSDKSVEKLKGEGRPFVSEKDRAFILSQLVPVDAVSVFEEETPLDLIKLVMPDVLVKGGDYTEEILEKTVVEAHGGKISIVSFKDCYYTTQIKNKITSL